MKILDLSFEFVLNIIDFVEELEKVKGSLLLLIY